MTARGRGPRSHKPLRLPRADLIAFAVSVATPPSSQPPDVTPPSAPSAANGAPSRGRPPCPRPHHPLPRVVCSSGAGAVGVAECGRRRRARGGGSGHRQNKAAGFLPAARPALCGSACPTREQAAGGKSEGHPDGAGHEWWSACIQSGAVCVVPLPVTFKEPVLKMVSGTLRASRRLVERTADGPLGECSACRPPPPLHTFASNHFEPPPTGAGRAFGGIAPRRRRRGRAPARRRGAVSRFGSGCRPACGTRQRAASGQPPRRTDTQVHKGRGARGSSGGPGRRPPPSPVRLQSCAGGRTRRLGSPARR